MKKREVGIEPNGKAWEMFLAVVSSMNWNTVEQPDAVFRRAATMTQIGMTVAKESGIIE